jgi:Cytidylate kinase-like family
LISKKQWGRVKGMGKEIEMFNVLTVAREYGSGGADIGRKVAELLGWVCLDKQIIERVAALGKVDPTWAEEADEHASAWWERVMKSFRHGGPESYVGEGPEFGVDRDTLQQFTASVIEQAAKEGSCVVIGRSSQCVLNRHPTALHVLVFAPLAEKTARMKLRHPSEHDLQALLRRVDSERTQYTQRYYGHDWSDRGLYHLCLNSTLGIDACAKLIVQTIQFSQASENRPLLPN